MAGWLNGGVAQRRGQFIMLNGVIDLAGEGVRC